MQIRTIRRDSKHSNANSNQSKVFQSIRIQTRAIRKGFEAFECKFEVFESDSSILKQILAIRKGLEAFERKF